MPDHSDIVDIRLAELDRRIDQRFDYESRALQVAKASMDQRLEGMNEFRSQLEKQAREFIPRSEHDILVAQIRLLDQWKERQEGKQSRSNLIALAALAVALLASLLDIIKTR